jgi:hypothetical protein
MPQVFEVTAPDGRTVTLEGDGVPTEAELTQIFAKLPPRQTSQPTMPAGGPVYRSAAAVGRAALAIPQMLGSLTERSTNPIEAGLLSGAGAPPGFGNVIRGDISARAEQRQKGGEAFDRGDYVEAGLRKAAGIVPVLGPMAASVGERFASGDWAGASM